jgi:hypothetical protein
MRPNLQVSCFVYGLLLRLYPGEFRRRFGAEMRQIFAEQMQMERRRRGFRGTLFVWLTVTREVISAALPLQLRSSIMIAAALSFLLSSILCLAFFRAVSP